MKLKELRKQKNLTQLEISRLLNVATTTYNGYETEKYEPTIETLCKLSDFYNVSLDYLVGRDFQNDIGYLTQEQKTALQLIKNLSSNNLSHAISFMQGLYINQ
ncbi:MAG: helix-turn-helix transcriptional regulator [Clostridiales bacterium]|nr:helix-turn-helix transcriptional regulator [Clostridiales bacterium]